MKIPRGSINALRQRRTQGDGGEVPFKVGDLIAGRYEVRDTIGRGPFGVVFKTFDQELESEVAVKVFGGQWLQSDEGKARFESAVRQARRLSQQNIIRLYDSDFDQDRAFVAMQFLEGINLRGVLKLREDKKEPFSLEEVEPLLMQMTRALEYCHRSGFHGDLKPENILLLPERLKITDFFIHEAVGADSLSADREVSVYTAPEVREDANMADPGSDLYAVAVIVAELLGGQAFNVDLVLPSANNPQLPDGVDEIISRATHSDPGERYTSLEAFAEALLSVGDKVLESLSELEILDEVETPRSVAPLQTDISGDHEGSQDGSNDSGFDPLDIPTPLNIAEGPVVPAPPENTSEAILLDDLEGLELIEEEDLETSAMPSIDRPPPPDIPTSVNTETTSVDAMMPMMLEASMKEASQEPVSVTEAFIESSPEVSREAPTSPDVPIRGKAAKEKKPFMKPVEAKPRLPEPPPVVTERVKSLPRVKAQGGSVEDPKRARLTLALVAMSIVILLAVGVGVTYAQLVLPKQNTDVVQIRDFGKTTSQDTPVK
jgi:serine/threonine protein kinase